ncbi:MAG TPA: FlgD immunoglobulin-like domain containing protein [bacterium]|nr:FlgD immunoglobulin-like domain containing protein [bacterium]
MQNRKSILYLTILLCLAVFSSASVAQKMALAPLTEIVSVINGDTTATGQRLHTEYGLQPGGIYFALGQIKNNFPLKISAAGATAQNRAIIKILVNESGASVYPFKPFHDFTLEGVFISGVNVAGGNVNAVIQTGTKGVSITLKNCEFDSVNSRVVIMDQNYCSLFAYDCAAHNSGTSNKTGRFLDARSTFADSIVIQNCTFYNLYHCVMNRFGGQQTYFKADHITVYNVMTCPLRICEAPFITMTNSLFIQTGFLGYDAYWIKEYTNPAWLNILEDRDEWSRIEMCPLVQDTFVVKMGLTQKINAKYNNFWLDPAVYAVYADTVHKYVNMDFLTASLVGADSLTWISEDPGFTKAPVCKSIEMSQKVHSVPGSGGNAKEVGFDYTNPPYDFSYPTTKASYTAAAGGFPLGDLNWFPAQKAAWENWQEPSVAQKLDIAPFTEIVSVINGDTTATGQRLHTEYGLQPGGIYFALGQIKNNFPLKISAAGATAQNRAIIKILVNESGASVYPFKPFHDFTLEGVFISGVNVAGGNVNAVIQTGTKGVSITLKNCEFDSVNSRVVIMDQNYCSLFAYDCAAHNSGTSNKTGRFLDARSTFADSIVIQNCTFYNLYHCVMNRFGGQQTYFKADHITVYNVMTCPLRICEAPFITMTNSLFIQTGFLGYDAYWIKEYTNPAWLNILEDRDEWSRIEMCPLVQDTFVVKMGLTQKINAKYNNFWLDPAVYAVYADTVHKYVNMDFLTASLVGADSLTWISEDPGFTKAPVCKSIEMSQKVHSVPGSGGNAKEVGFDYTNPPYDFSYPTTKASYTAAAGGFPLGDLNWFPAQKAAWKNWINTGVPKSTRSTPTDFTLEQNYPNPFNPTTTIRYTTQSEGYVTLAVFNAIGQKVRTLVDQKQPAGTYSLQWDGCDDAGVSLSGGVYFYQIRAGASASVKKMIYLK